LPDLAASELAACNEHCGDGSRDHPRPAHRSRAPHWWEHRPDLDELAARPEVRRWFAAQPDPVVAAPDGSLWAVRPGAAVADVVAACARERPLRPVTAHEIGLVGKRGGLTATACAELVAPDVLRAAAGAVVDGAMVRRPTTRASREKRILLALVAPPAGGGKPG
jgi:hypothetical protein